MLTPVRALLTDLIDYAGLFPPAGLDMTTAVRNYAAYERGEYQWMLGKFIVPAARVEEFRGTAPDARWDLSVLGVDEVRPERVDDIAAGPTQYFEIPIASDPAGWIAAISRAGARAKIRTGSATPDSIPEAATVARFLFLAARARVAFKATAGLHHAVRSASMHGFLNLFLAAALIHGGGSEGAATDLLNEQSPASFQFGEDAFRWRNVVLTTDKLRNARENFAISFGSCSFEEPVADLKSIGLL